MRPLKVVARDSLLSQRQVEEVYLALKQHRPEILFDVTCMKTIGDLQRTVSLMGMDKTNFFTKELDEWILAGKADVAVHSAKDLPEPLPEGLAIYALTKGLDPSDSLVLQENKSVQTLPIGAKIGTSSQRRIETLRGLREDFIPVDIRGSILERLSLLEKGDLDGVIVAEAALMRLRLTHLHRILLSGDVPLMQGRLAIVGKKNNLFLQEIFESIHYGDKAWLQASCSI